MSIPVNDQKFSPVVSTLTYPNRIPRSLDYPFLMADHDVLSRFYNESKDFTSAIESHLAVMTTCDLDRKFNGPKVWSFSQQQAWFAIYEFSERCFELGAASIKLSHEVIAFLSSPNENNSAATPSEGQPLGVTIEAITIASTKLQKAATMAEGAISAVEQSEPSAHWDIVFVLGSDFSLYLQRAKKQHLPLGQWAEKLGEILSSIATQGIVTTGVMINNIIAMFQGHVVRVCLHGLSLTEKFGSSWTASIDSPLMGNFYRELLPDAADYVGVLANYVKDTSRYAIWCPDKLTYTLDKNIISILMDLETHLSDFPDEMTFPPSEVLAQYAAVFTSLFSAFSSIFSVEQHLDTLMTSNTHTLALDLSVAFRPLLIHREAAQGALLKAQDDVNSLVSRLKQFQEDSVVTGWLTLPEHVPEDLKCFKCVITVLLNHAETDLPKQIHQWKWITSEPKSGVTFLDVIRPLFSNPSINRRNHDLAEFKGLFRYHEAEVDNSVELDIRLLEASEPPCPLHLAFGPHHNLQMFWSQFSFLVNKGVKPEQSYPGKDHFGFPTETIEACPPTETIESYSPKAACPMATLEPRWRPCTCKKQIEFVAQSRQVKSCFQANSQQDPTQVANLLKPSFSSKKTPTNTKGYGGSLQGDWSF